VIAGGGVPEGDSLGGRLAVNRDAFTVPGRADRESVLIPRPVDTVTLNSSYEQFV